MNEILVSVAEAIGRDPTTGNGLFYGRANLSSTFTLSMDETDVRAGIGNPSIYRYKHSKNLAVNIEQATMDSTIIALNSGKTVLNESVTALKTDCVVLSSGSGTLTATPTSVVNVFLPDGTIQDVTATGSAIFVSGGGNQRVSAVYNYTVTADRIVIGTTNPPSIIDLTLIAEIRDQSHTTVIKYLQINIPYFQVSGNYELSMTANGTSNQSLEGNALKMDAVDCTSGDYYANITFIPVSATTVPISHIAATPSTINISVAAGLPKTAQITLLGIRGGVYQNTNLTTSGSYAKAAGGTAAAVTVGAGTGVVTAGSASGSGQSCVINCTYYDAASGSLVDYVTVNINA